MPIFEFKGPDGQTHSIEGPEGATQEQAFQMLQRQLGGQSAPEAPQESKLSDTAKTVAAGLEQGASTAVGLPGDVATFAHDIAPQGVIDAVKAIPGAKYLYDHLPTKQAINDYAKVHGAVDPDYEPQYGANRYTKAVVSNLGPGLASGMGVVPTVTSALAGQGAYDATGSHLAEAGAGLIGGLAPGLAKAAMARRAMQSLKDAPTVVDEARQVYNGPELASAIVSPQSLKDLAQNTDTMLARRQFDPDAMREVRQIIDNRWHDANQPQTIADLQNTRARLNELTQGAPTTQTAAARAVKGQLDDYLNNLDATQVVGGNAAAGGSRTKININGQQIVLQNGRVVPGGSALDDAQRAVDLLHKANENYRYGNSGQKIGNIIQQAADTAGSHGSGLNGGNLTRQGLKPLLADDAAALKRMGMGSADDIDAVRTAVQKGGSTATNLMRHASNMAGGGGGIGSLLIGHTLATMGVGGVGAGAEGYREGGLPTALAYAAAGATPGLALRLIANAKTRKAAQALQNTLLERAPANQGIVKANNALKAANSYRAVFDKNLPGLGNMVLSRLLNGGS